MCEGEGGGGIERYFEHKYRLLQKGACVGCFCMVICNPSCSIGKNDSTYFIIKRNGCTYIHGRMHKKLKLCN